MPQVTLLPTRELSKKDNEIFCRSYVQMLFASLSAGVTELPSELLDCCQRLGLNINLPNEFGQTVMMVALSKRMPTANIRALVRVGARLDLVDKMDKTVLMYALQHTDLEQKCLLDWIGACANIDLKDRGGKTLLMHAFEQQCPEAVLNAILEKGASVKCADRLHKRVFVYAVENNAPKVIVEAMCKQGAIFDMHTAGQQVLEYATQHGMVELAQRCTVAGACLDDSFHDRSFEGEDAAPVGERLKNHWKINFEPTLQRLRCQSDDVYAEVVQSAAVTQQAKAAADWVIARCQFLQPAEMNQFKVIVRAAVHSLNDQLPQVLVFKLIDLIADEPGQVEFRRSHGAFIGGALQVCFTEKSVLFAEATQFIGWMEGQAAADHVAFQPGCVAAIKAEVKKEKDCIIYVRDLYKAGYSNLARFGAKAFKQRRDRPLDQLKECSSFRESIKQLRSRVQGKAPGEKSKSRDVLEVLMAQSQIATDAARDAAIGQSKGKLTAELLAALQVRRDIICQQPKVVKAAATSAQPGDGDAASTKRGRPGF